MLSRPITYIGERLESAWVLKIYLIRRKTLKHGLRYEVVVTVLSEDELIILQDYELKTMVPAESNHFVANYTLEELLHILPEQFGIKNFARRISITLLDDIVREAMM